MIRTAFIIALGLVWAGVSAVSLAQEQQEPEQERQMPEPFKTSKTKQMTGTVQAVSQSDRHLVVMGSDGSRVLMEVGENISDFDNVKPGDRVSIMYHEGMVAEVKPPGEGAQSQMETAKSKGDEMPTKGIGRTIATTVQIESVDASNDTVTFKAPDGITRELAVENPQAKEFIQKLKPGDEVQVTYREAAAVSIKPAARG